MKLFKKLAAAVLVAALALMMVGCGGSKTGFAQQVKNAVSDYAVITREQATNSKELDALAAKLLTEYDKAIAASEEGDQLDLQDLLDDETFLQKFGIDPATDAYAVSLVYIPGYISNTMNQLKPFSLASQLRNAEFAIGDPEIGKKYEFGLAIGTRDGENGVLMLKK